jgi:quercetin dioxygenase-like cupin family protein
VLTRVVVKPNSRGKPHFHPAEQVSMILRGGVRVSLNGTERVAMAGSIVHIPGNAVHMFEILGEETEILDVYTVASSVEDLKKRYPPAP